MASRTRRTRRQANPWIATLNPGVLIGRGVPELAYETHAKAGRGPWLHKYRRSDIEVRGLPGGSVLLRSASGAPLWTREGGRAWLSNSHKEIARMARKRTLARRKSRRRPPKGFRTWKSYMAFIRSRKDVNRRAIAMKRRHRRTNDPGGRHRHRRAHARHGRRGFRRNPPAAGVVGLLVDGVKGGLLVTGGKVVSRAVPHMIGLTPTGLAGLGVQFGIGAVASYLLERFASREISRPFLYGVVGNVNESLLRSWNLPVISPALGDETELHTLAGYYQEDSGVAGYLHPGDTGMAGDMMGSDIMAA